MLKIQEWLKNNGGDFKLLNAQLGITANPHPSDERVILNYSQIDSPKQHPVVRECRGLVLNRNTFEIIARSFPRFFNWGEHLPDIENFQFDGSLAQDKEDGSLILVYAWNGEWHVNTRNSFSDGKPFDECPFTWRELVVNTLRKNKSDLLDNAEFLDGFTFVFELCSPFNKVVREYSEPALFLLTVFDHVSKELSHRNVDDLAEDFNLSRPRVHRFDDVHEAMRHIKDISINDPTYEGLVLRDINNLRIKAKSDKYVALHRLSSNGNLFLTKNIVPLVLDNELDEVKIYFKEGEEKFNFVKQQVDKLWLEVEALWFCHWDEKNQKRFAMAVKDHPLSAILFAARKEERDLREVFVEHKDLIIKVLT